jgi:hypothetical protein
VCGTAEAVPFVKRRFPIWLSTVRFAKTFRCYCSSGAPRPAIFYTQPDFRRWFTILVCPINWDYPTLAINETETACDVEIARGAHRMYTLTLKQADGLIAEVQAAVRT